MKLQKPITDDDFPAPEPHFSDSSRSPVGSGFGTVQIRQDRNFHFLRQEHPAEDLVVRDRDGQTALHFLTYKDPTSEHVEIVSLLLNKCPSLADSVTFMTGKPAGWTALHGLCDLPQTQNTEARLHEIANLIL